MMLTGADARLIKRDPSIPGLAIVLDPEAMLDLLKEPLAGCDLQSIRVCYVRYKPGTNCLVGYELRTGRDLLCAYAKAFSPSAIKLKTVGETRASNRSGPAPLIFKDLAVAVSLFPSDGDLPVLPRVADAEARERLLRRVVASRQDLWSAELQTLVYKPNRRYVGRLLVDGEPRAKLKVYLESDFARTNARAKLVKPGSTLKFAQRLGRSKRHSLLALDWMPGILLRDQLSDPQFNPAELSRVGSATAELHSRRSPQLQARNRKSEAASLADIAKMLRMLSPKRGECAARVARRLAQGLLDGTDGDCLIHGDFYAKQVILAGTETVGFLDLDEAGSGDPERDLGNFIAHVYGDSQRGKLPAERVGFIRDALLRGYDMAGGRMREEKLRFYISLGLFRLTFLPFRDRDPQWPERLEEILELAMSYST